MIFKHKQYCVDCHFFVKKESEPGSRLEASEIKAPERGALRQGNDPLKTRDCELSCSFGVWDEGLDFFAFLPDYRHQLIVKKDQAESCFYREYHPGMGLPAASILQEREAKNRDAARDRLLTRIALWIAVFALFVNAVASFGNADVLKLLELFFKKC